MSDFIAFAHAHGVLIGDLYAGDRIRRCPTDQNPRKKNGAWFWDGERGFCFAWDGEAKAQWYHDPAAKPWTAEEKAAWQEKRRAMDVEHKRGQERVALRAQELMRTSTPGAHNYLAMKGFPKAQGLVLEDGALLVPMRNVLTNAVQGAQLIRWIEEDRKYEKKMLPGMKAKGAVLRLGNHTRETLLVEGYATGLSVEAAARSVGLNAAVLVTFSDFNLVHVAPMVKGHALIYADNDKSGAGERAAKETGLPYCMSDTEGHDANDDHQHLGLMAVCKKLMEVRRQAVASG
jgi:putative DNA primase/helicase